MQLKQARMQVWAVEASPEARRWALYNVNRCKAHGKVKVCTPLRPSLPARSLPCLLGQSAPRPGEEIACQL